MRSIQSMGAATAVAAVVWAVAIGNGLMWLSGCGARAGIDEVEPAQLEELAELEEPLIADNNFGVLAGSHRQCNAGSTGHCWYPSGFGAAYPWRVCPISSGVTQTQAVRATQAQLHVMQTLRNGGVDIRFDCLGGSGNGSEIRVFKGAAPGLSCGSACDPDDIRRYVTMFCTSQQPLSESPSISGQHAYCYRYNVEIDYNAIDAAFPIAADALHVYEQATGFIFSAASLGTGLHSVASLSNYWTYDNVFPLPKHDVHPADYCRADANYEGVDFFFIRKQDNACD